AAAMLRSPTIRVPQLKKLLTEKSPLRLLDVAYTLKEPANHYEFAETNYGKFEKLMKEKAHPDYVKEHIPGATHFNLDIASYPGKYERASLYPPDLFQEYIQRLGINKGDTVVVYGRGHSAGMLFAARAWWLLKMYGMHTSVLEGGLEKWKEAGGAVTDTVDKRELGNWTASAPREDLIVLYDDLMREGTFEKLDQVNMLDCRPSEEFYGTKPLAFPPNGAPGARIAGSKCVPLSAILSTDGELKTTGEIREVLKLARHDPSVPTYTICNGGTQAALLGLALDKAGVKWSLFNGSLREVSKRNPSLINTKG
ncbi:hypothetical protein PFISCL1PPCAC_8997, partial [Pristionchus fissidentatus]